MKKYFALAIGIFVLLLPSAASSAANFHIAAAQELQPVLWTMVGMLVAVYALFLLFRNRKRPHTRPEAFPPGAPPAETGYILNGVVTDRDIASLFIDWAQNGYIAICEGERGGIVLVKLREPDGDAALYEKLLLNELFRENDELTLDAPQERLRTAWKETGKRIRIKYEDADKRIYTKASLILQDAICMLSAFPVAITAAIAGYGISGVPIASTLTGAAVFFLGYALSASYVKLAQAWCFGGAKKKRRGLLLWVALMLAFLCGALALYNAGGVWQLLWWAAPLCGVLMMLPAPSMRRRTQRGLELQEKLLGLRQWVEQAGAAQMQTALTEESGYFYTVLPYAYALGMARMWIEKFGTAIASPPEWLKTERQGQGAFEDLLLRVVAGIQKGMTEK